MTRSRTSSRSPPRRYSRPARKPWRTSLGAVAFAIFFAAPGFAQETRDACRDDASKLCPGVEAGEARIFNCLTAKPDQLSVGCKAALGMLGGRNIALQSCIPEIEKYCKGSRGAQALSCLETHHDRLTELCRAALAQTPAAE